MYKPSKQLQAGFYFGSRCYEVTHVRPRPKAEIRDVSRINGSPRWQIGRTNLEQNPSLFAATRPPPIRGVDESRLNTAKMKPRTSVQVC